MHQVRLGLTSNFPHYSSLALAGDKVSFCFHSLQRNALSDRVEDGVELLSESIASDSEYTDYIASPSDETQAVQHTSIRLALKASRYGMYFIPSEYKVLLQNWKESPLVLTL